MAREHYVCPAVVVVRIFQRNRPLFHERLRYGFRKPVLYFGVRGARKILLHHMDESVDYPVARLAFGQRVGECRVEHRKLRIDLFGGECELFAYLPAADNRIHVHLGARSRQGEYRSQRQGVFYRQALFEYVPRVFTLVRYGRRDKFAGVYHRPAAERDYEVEFFVARELYGLHAGRILGVRLYPAEFRELALADGGDGLGVGSVFLHRPPAVNQ